MPALAPGWAAPVGPIQIASEIQASAASVTASTAIVSCRTVRGTEAAARTPRHSVHNDSPRQIVFATALREPKRARNSLTQDLSHDEQSRVPKLSRFTNRPFTRRSRDISTAYPIHAAASAGLDSMADSLQASSTSTDNARMLQMTRQPNVS